MGTGFVSWGPEVLPGEEAPDAAEAWTRIEAAVREAAPDVEVGALRGPGRVLRPRRLHDHLRRAAARASRSSVLPRSTSTVRRSPSPTTAAVLGPRPGDGARSSTRPWRRARGRLHRLRRRPRPTRRSASETWREGSDEAEVETLDAGRRRSSWRGTGSGSARPRPARSCRPRLAEDLGLEVVTTEPAPHRRPRPRRPRPGSRSRSQGAVDGTYVYVERGYQRPDEAVIILLVLGALGGVLMLGGTLTATFLALSDARPDLATLSAVGAAPRTRRRVAAAYALVIGFVGAVLGAVVGLHPRRRDLAAADRRCGSGGAAPDGPFLAIPWLLIARRSCSRCRC